MSYTIVAKKREEEGTGASRRLRRAGVVPGIMYGRKTADGKRAEPVKISVDANKLWYDLQKPDFHTSLLDLDLEGQTCKVLLRDFQMHPFRRQVLHIDLQPVEPGERIRARVPLRLLNAASSPAVKLHGGRIMQLTHSVEILVDSDKIPNELTLDLIAMTGAEIKHLSDIPLPDGAEAVLLRRGVNPPVASASGKEAEEAEGEGEETAAPAEAAAPAAEEAKPAEK